MAEKILFKEESYKIVGVCMKIHNKLGAGFLEAVYQEVLAEEFLNEKIPFQREVKLEIYYDGKKLKKYYRADFLCYDNIVLEIKSLIHVPEAGVYQLKNYLKATKKELGILVNFGKPSLEYKRIVNLVNN